MAAVMSVEPPHWRIVSSFIAKIAGILLLCLVFVLTYSELHGSSHPSFSAGMMFWAIVPLLVVQISKRARAFSDASVDRFFVLYFLTLVALMFPQFSIAFRDQQYEIKEAMGAFANLFPVLVVLVCMATSLLLSLVVHASATLGVRALYALTIGAAVSSLFLVA